MSYKMDSTLPPSYEIQIQSLSTLKFRVKPTSTMLCIIGRPSTSNQSKQWIKSQKPVVALLHLMKFPRCVENEVQCT